MKKVISWTIWLLMVGACVRPGLGNIIEYAEQEKNGLRKTISLGTVTYTLQYKPAAYILATEGIEAKDQRFAIRNGQLKGMAWFNFSIAIPGFEQSPLRYGIADLASYQSRQDYFLNQAAADAYLLYGSDTLYPTTYWFENGLNLIPHETMVFGFALPEGQDQAKEEMVFSFHDRCFKNGIVKASINKSDLDKIQY
jgi:hypothetical protein